MHKTLVGLALAALIANPATAQDYRRNFVECAKELGLNLDPNYIQKLQDGRTVRKWYFHSDAQVAPFNDCLARKANLAAKPSAKGAPRVSRSHRRRP
jgi:hypothetical protein